MTTQNLLVELLVEELPPKALKKLGDAFAAALAKVLAMPDVHDQLTKMGLTVGYMNSHQLEQRERAYTQVWTKLIKNSGFQPQ